MKPKKGLYLAYKTEEYYSIYNTNMIKFHARCWRYCQIEQIEKDVILGRFKYLNGPQRDKGYEERLTAYVIGKQIPHIIAKTIKELKQKIALEEL